MQTGGVYHVIWRFVAKQWLVAGPEERRTYLRLFGRAIAETDWRCFCFAVMSSHVHVGLIAGTSRLAQWMRPMHTTFARWVNERHERIGAVFVRGPKVVAVREPGVPHLINYVHQNPVKARVFKRAIDSDWTSHRAYLGLVTCPDWLDVTVGLKLSGFSDAREFVAWADGRQTTREELDAFRVHPLRGRGRPRRLVSVATNPQSDAAGGAIQVVSAPLSRR